MNKYIYTLSCAILLSACAGMNPNPGERTVDTAWTQGDFQRAYEISKPAAEAGEPWAELRLGVFYANGWGTEVDIDKAKFWYKKASAQKTTGDWANGLLAGASGKAGYFNQNSDALIAQFNLAQLYADGSENLSEALELVEGVISESEGRDIFFCCEFSGGRYFTQDQFNELKAKIQSKMNDQ